MPTLSDMPQSTYPQRLSAVTSNPTLARQFQNQRQVVSPPTSVMDERYPAYANAQTGADAFGAATGFIPGPGELASLAKGLLAAKGISGLSAAIIAGPLSRTANKITLSRAQQMQAAGADNNAIWRETGWYSGPEGKWKYEIPNTLEAISGAYPGIEKIPQRSIDAPADLRGYHAPGVLGIGEKIGINFKSADPWSTYLHELQHAVQKREGFATGGSPEQFQSGAFKQLRVANPSMSDSAVGAAAGRQAFEQYRTLAGEAEARAVQARITADNSLPATPPWKSYDVPLDRLRVK